MQEIKSRSTKVETVLSPSLKAKFKSRCKKLNVSAAQRLRDIVQQDLKK